MNLTILTPAPESVCSYCLHFTEEDTQEVKTCVAQVAELGFEPSCLAGALKLYAP